MNNISSADEAAELAVALGVPLFKSDLHIPDYTTGIVGRWKLVRTGFSLDHGYFSGGWCVFGMPVLLYDRVGDGKSWETWMSLSPHEIESQELACRYAGGHTVVMGLGMGWVAVNIALNPAVRRVTVVERDPEVIGLSALTGALKGLPGEIAAKLRIVRADALEWTPDEPVDFLYADIWLSIEEPRALDDVRAMQANCRADQVYFWGQELLIHRLLRAVLEESGEESGGGETLRRLVAEKTGLPLLIPGDRDYPRMILEAAARRSERRPAIPASCP